VTRSIRPAGFVLDCIQSRARAALNRFLKH
jgi:hypothetical protein